MRCIHPYILSEFIIYKEILYMNGWLSTTSTWLKKQYFNSAHYLELISNQVEKLQGDIFLFGIKFGDNNQK